MREIIHSTRETPDQYRPVVTWERDTYLQVGIQVQDPNVHLVDLLYDQAVLGENLVRYLDEAGWRLVHVENGAHVTPSSDAALGQMVMDALRESRSPVERDGIWNDLDRRQTNRLIATLRKAGAAVFGRDEW